jgi:hypothetical protein
MNWASGPSRFPARQSPHPPAGPSSTATASASWSSGGPDAKAGSATSSAATAGTAPSWTEGTEQRSGADTGYSPTTWSRSAPWQADPAPDDKEHAASSPPNSAPRLFQVEVANRFSDPNGDRDGLRGFAFGKHPDTTQTERTSPWPGSAPVDQIESDAEAAGTAGVAGPLPHGAAPVAMAPPLTSSSFHSWAKRATSEHRPVDQVRPPCRMVVPLVDQLSSLACRYRQRSAPHSADLCTWPAAGADGRHGR